MGTRKIEKATAIIIALFVTLLSFLHISDWASVGIYANCPVSCRLSYPFFHANALHAILNVWCFLVLVFTYDISYWRLILAYVIATTIPVDTLGTFLPMNNPTVGLSGVVYVLMGSISCEVMRKRYYQVWMCFYIAMGFLFPNTNAWIHLYCYLFGIIYALLNCPIKKKNRGVV